MDIMKFSSVLM